MDGEEFQGGHMSSPPFVGGDVWFSWTMVMGSGSKME